MNSPETGSKITGASTSAFERACFAVREHGDGTGTIVLDWYETSDGRDFMTYEAFMRTEIKAARKIVKLLNANLPGGISATLEYEAHYDDED